MLGPPLSNYVCDIYVYKYIHIYMYIITLILGVSLVLGCSVGVFWPDFVWPRVD